MSLPIFFFCFKEFIVACSSICMLAFKKFLSGNLNICLISVLVSVGCRFPWIQIYRTLHMLNSSGSHAEPLSRYVERLSEDPAEDGRLSFAANCPVCGPDLSSVPHSNVLHFQSFFRALWTCICFARQPDWVPEAGFVVHRCTGFMLSGISSIRVPSGGWAQMSINTLTGLFYWVPSSLYLTSIFWYSGHLLLVLWLEKWGLVTLTTCVRTKDQRTKRKVKVPPPAWVCNSTKLTGASLPQSGGCYRPLPPPHKTERGCEKTEKEGEKVGNFHALFLS